jgi:hypothetical protein
MTITKRLIALSLALLALIFVGVAGLTQLSRAAAAGPGAEQSGAEHRWPEYGEGLSG